MHTPCTTSSPQGENAPSARAPILFAGFEEDPDLCDCPRAPRLEDDGNNYLDWEHHNRSLFKIRGLWRIVNGDIPIPDPSAPPNERAEWSYKDQQATAQIKFTIKNEPLKAIIDTKTSKECWDKLSAWYQRMGQPRLLGLFKQVISSSFSDAEPLRPQINALVQATLIMDSLGMGTDDKFLAFAILSALPSSLSYIRTNILCHTAMSESDISSVYVTRYILDDEVFRNFRKFASGSAKSAKKGKGAKKKQGS